MARSRETRGRPLELLSPERLVRILRLRRGHRPGRPRPQVYGEDEVRDMIYGWHSGTVEPPQPADSTTLAATVKGGSQQAPAEQSLAFEAEPRPGAGPQDGGER